MKQEEVVVEQVGKHTVAVDLSKVVIVPDNFEDGEFREDRTLETILNNLRERNEFADVADQNILIRWKAMGGKDRGKERWGQIIKASPILQHLVGADFVIWIAADHLLTRAGNGGIISAKTVEAIVYHELCHLSYDPESGAVGLKGHDFEGFIGELETYGAWRLDLQIVVKKMQQLKLFEKKE